MCSQLSNKRKKRMKTCLVVFLLVLACACGGGGGSGAVTSPVPEPSTAFDINVKDREVLKGSWEGVSYKLDGKEHMPIGIRKTIFSFKSSGGWSGNITGDIGPYGFGINTFFINSRNDYESYVTVTSFNYEQEDQNRLNLVVTYSDVTGSHVLQHKLLRKGVDSELVGTYDIDINSYKQTGYESLSSYGYKSGYFEIDSYGTCTVTLVGLKKQSTVSEVTIRTNGTNYFMCEKFGLVQSGIGTIEKTGNIYSLNISYSDNTITTFISTKK